MKITVVNKTKRRIKAPLVRKIIGKTIEISGRKINNITLSIVFASRKEMRLINKAYRKKNRPTDVLSFDYSSGYNKKQEKEKIEGEIILSPEIIAKSAEKNKVAFNQELAYVLAHGVLHILGFRHGKRMCEMQDEVYKILNS